MLIRSCSAPAFAALVVVSTPALAASPAEEAPTWSIGVGATLFSTPIVGGLGGGALGAGLLQTSLAPSVAIERALLPDLWLRFQGNVGYQTNEQEEGALQSSRFDTGLEAGLRYVVAELGPVDVSGVLAAFVSRGASTFDIQAGQTLDSRIVAAGGKLGFAVDYALVDSLFLRLSSEVTRVSFSSTSSELFDGGQIVGTEGSGVSAELTLAPALELRIAF